MIAVGRSVIQQGEQINPTNASSSNNLLVFAQMKSLFPYQQFIGIAHTILCAVGSQIHKPKIPPGI